MRVEDAYDINIYGPGNAKEPWKAFSSETPFLSIHEGDLVDCAGWPGPRPPSATLRVVNVRHRLIEMGVRVRHVVDVFTEHFSGDPTRSSRSTSAAIRPAR